MSIRNVWSVLCRRTSIDNVSNNISIFEVLEEIQFQVPKQRFLEQTKNSIATGESVLFPFEFEVVSLWENLKHEPGSKMRIIMKTPSGAIHHMGESELNFNNVDRLRVRVQSRAIPIKESGHHEIVVQHIYGDKDEPVGILPLMIKLELQ